jgi:hypothetical protein
VTTVQVFLSAVTAEFRSYRDALRHDLDRPNVTVKVQEDFIATGTETLDKLDGYIRKCDAVIHLVGDMTGALAQPSSVAVIRERYPDFDKRLPVVSHFLQPDAPALSYTEWEAWLALYHRKMLIIAVPRGGAARGERHKTDEAQQAAQRAHLARLASVERYPEIEFANADRLAVDVLRSGLHDLLAPGADSDAATIGGGTLAPGELTIDRVMVTQDQPRTHEQYFTEKKCVVDFWVTNRGGSQVVVLAVDFEVLETGRAELVKGPMPSSATYDLDLTDLTKTGQHAVCPTSQVIAPGESDRFSISLVARLGLGVFAAWKLRPTVQTNFGDLVAAPVEVWLPFVDSGTSFEQLMGFAWMERARDAINSAIETKDGERLLEIFEEALREGRVVQETAFALSLAAQDEVMIAKIGARLLSLCERLAEKATDGFAASGLWATCARLRHLNGENDRALECVQQALLASPGAIDAVDILTEMIEGGAVSARNVDPALALIASHVKAGDLDASILERLANALERGVMPATSTPDVELRIPRVD